MPSEHFIQRDCPDTADAWKLAVQSVLHEGQGVWRLAVVSGANIDSLCQRAMAGDLDAERCLTMLPRLFETLDSYEEPSPAAPTCLVCGASLWRGCAPGAVIVLSAARDEPSRVLVSAVCGGCWIACGTDTNRQTAILDGVRRNYGLEGLRVLPPLSAAGRA
jgi:hypothetical protein